MSRHILNILLVITLIFTAASCSKQTEQSPSSGVTGQGISSGLPNLTAEDAFSLSREGEKVLITIKVDFSPCKVIAVLRNKTGMTDDRVTAAQLKPDVKRVEDIVPDAKPYWYWVKAISMSGETRIYGPTRIGPDAEKTGKYVAASPLPWTVTRTQTTATITWDCGENTSSVAIKRNSNKSAKDCIELFSDKGPKGTYEDTFPDTEADYWYWIETTLKTGAVVGEGPRKAVFVEN